LKVKSFGGRERRRRGLPRREQRGRRENGDRKEKILTTEDTESTEVRGKEGRRKERKEGRKKAELNAETQSSQRKTGEERRSRRV